MILACNYSHLEGCSTPIRIHSVAEDYLGEFDFWGPNVQITKNLFFEEIYDGRVDEIERFEHEQELILEINSYRHLEKDWDRYGGVPPSRNVIKDAISFIMATSKDIPFPKASVSGRGKIGLYWNQPEGLINVLFVGNGCVSYYACIEEEKEFFGDDEPFDVDKIPHNLLVALNFLR